MLQEQRHDGCLEAANVGIQPRAPDVSRTCSTLVSEMIREMLSTLHRHSDADEMVHSCIARLVELSMPRTKLKKHQSIQMYAQ